MMNQASNRYFRFAKRMMIPLAIMMIPAVASSQEGGFSIPPDTLAFSEPPPYSDVKEKAPKNRLFSGRPGKAALYSLILPGAGQIYNKKYWKAPIVWGALGGMGYWMYFNIDQYNDYGSRYEQALKDGADPEGQYTTEQLRLLRNQANKNRQLSIFLFALTWVANSVEAFTDAHMMEFDVNEDLSIVITPAYYDAYAGTTGIGVAIRF